MDIKAAFREIESHETSAQLNLAPNLRHLFLYAEQLESVQKLRELLEKQDNINLTLMRIVSLTNETIDHRFENPYDIAITVYTWALFLRLAIAGKIAADEAAKLRQGWLAPKYARHVEAESANFTASAIEWGEDESVISYSVEDAIDMNFRIDASPVDAVGLLWEAAPLRYQANLEISFQSGEVLEIRPALMNDNDPSLTGTDQRLSLEMDIDYRPHPSPYRNWDYQLTGRA